MTNYYSEENFTNIRYSGDMLNFTEYEGCSFTECTFNACSFLAVTFIDCSFVRCNFDQAQVAHTAFRTATFKNCSIKDVNFSMSEKFIFEIHFENCTLDFSKFYGLKLKAATFTDCSAVAVDFMEADLTGVVFQNCDFYRAEFGKAVAVKADFSTSYNYTIDPANTKIKNAIFALNEVKGLLFKHELAIS